MTPVREGEGKDREEKLRRYSRRDTSRILCLAAEKLPGRRLPAVNAKSFVHA